MGNNPLEVFAVTTEGEETRVRTPISSLPVKAASGKTSLYIHSVPRRNKRDLALVGGSYLSPRTLALPAHMEQEVWMMKKKVGDGATTAFAHEDTKDN